MCIRDRVAGDFRLPAITVRQEFVLVVIELLTGFRGELEIRSLDDGIHGAGFLTEAAIDAFRHVDIVARRAAAAVIARLGLDGDGLRRAHGLAQLAGNAALLAVRIAAQRMLAPEARRQAALLIGIVDGDLRLEEVLQRQEQALAKLEK